ncbi:hypothetical protein U6B65_12670 [Oscillospiraceae bacterium MB08-C2-2]|nr:hypothetical protein U6B65_12670 [Oscillospiraceae bacterium MB08-C2-2]
MLGSDAIAALTAVAAIFVVVFVIALVVDLVMYILRSIGLWNIGTNRRLPNPWLAWIPVVWAYSLGNVADDINQRTGKKTVYRYLLLGGSILAGVFGAAANGPAFMRFREFMEELQYGYADPRSLAGLYTMGGLLSLVGLAVKVIEYIALYAIYKEYKPQNAVLWTVLSVFFGFLPSIFLFTLRNAPTPAPYGYGSYGGQQWPNQGYANPNQGYAPPSWPGQQPGNPPYGGYYQQPPAPSANPNPNPVPPSGDGFSNSGGLGFDAQPKENPFSSPADFGSFTNPPQEEKPDEHQPPQA